MNRWLDFFVGVAVAGLVAHVALEEKRKEDAKPKWTPIGTWRLQIQIADEDMFPIGEWKEVSLQATGIPLSKWTFDEEGELVSIVEYDL